MSEGEFQQGAAVRARQARPRDVDEHRHLGHHQWLLKNVENRRPRGHGGCLAAGVPRGREHREFPSRSGHPKCPHRRLLHGRRRVSNGLHARSELRLLLRSSSRAARHAAPAHAVLPAPATPTCIDFFLRLPLRSRASTRAVHGGAAYWQEIVDHTTYDDFWKRRSWKFMDGVEVRVLNVGRVLRRRGSRGPSSRLSVEEKNLAIPDMLVMGPCGRHGLGTARETSSGNLSFSSKTGEYSARDPVPLLRRHLKDKAVDSPPTCS